MQKWMIFYVFHELEEVFSTKRFSQPGFHMAASLHPKREYLRRTTFDMVQLYKKNKK